MRLKSPIFPKTLSPLRYPGGKAKFLKKIIPKIYTPYDEFREPFVGGGSVFLTALKEINPMAKYRINDLNYSVFCFWKELKENGDELIDKIEQIRKVSLDGRLLYNQFKPKDISRSCFDEAVRFFVLNRITFSGITDCGGFSEESFQKRFTNSSINRLRILPKLLKNVIIENEDYESLIFEPGKSVFIFLDPPYFSASKSKLYGKNGDLHLFFDHNRFAQNMKKCRHHWLITYDDCLEIRQLFSFANIYIHKWQAQYGMNNVAASGTAEKGDELLISNYLIEHKEKV
jgi:DNA adenine methylase